MKGHGDPRGPSEAPDTCISEESNEACLLHVRIVPGASFNRWDGLFAEGRVKVRVAAPPVEGAANKSLREFVAESFSLNKSGVQLVRGEKSREKTLRLALSAALARVRLAALLAGES